MTSGRAFPRSEREILDRLSRRLGPATGAALRCALASRGGKTPVPGSAKVREDWKRAWRDWDRTILEGCDEEGKCVLQDHHWEPPSFDPTALTADLEQIAARMLALIPRVFDEKLDLDFSFARKVKESVEEIASSLPDWLPPFEQEAFALGPKATRALIEWERRGPKREGKTAFDLIDSLRAIDTSTKGLALDERTLAGFVRGLDRPARKAVMEGIRRCQGEDRWKQVLGKTYSPWFRIYQGLCRGQDRSVYIETCRARISQDWTLALPVIRDITKKSRRLRHKRTQHHDLVSICAEAVSSFLCLRDGKVWDPCESLLPAMDRGAWGGESISRLKEILSAWRAADRDAGRKETAAALRLQSDLLADWRNWDKALAAFRRVRSPLFDPWRERLFREWRSRAAGRDLNGSDEKFGSTWAHALIDAAREGPAAAHVFREDIRRRIRQAQESPESLRRAERALARLSLEVQGGAWLRRKWPSLARILAAEKTRDASLLASRSRWLDRMGASALVPDLLSFWRRNLVRLVPDPAADVEANYENSAAWLHALREEDPPAGRRLLDEWGVIHHRRRNLWRALREKGLPAPGMKR